MELSVVMVEILAHDKVETQRSIPAICNNDVSASVGLFDGHSNTGWTQKIASVTCRRSPNSFSFRYLSC